jgi:Ni/Fe-hydrogenase 1 B-type cytochrome subunit
MEAKKFIRVMVWELPVRLFHWLNVLAIIVLCITGFLIANPPALLSNAEATNLHSFGIVRFIHFVAAYISFYNDNENLLVVCRKSICKLACFLAIQQKELE